MRSRVAFGVAFLPAKSGTHDNEPRHRRSEVLESRQVDVICFPPATNGVQGVAGSNPAVPINCRLIGKARRGLSGDTPGFRLALGIVIQRTPLEPGDATRDNRRRLGPAANAFTRLERKAARVALVRATPLIEGPI